MTDWIGYAISFFGGTIIPSIGWIYTYNKDRAEKKEKQIIENSAWISANIVKHPKGVRTLKVFNSGKSEAKNVRITPIPPNALDNVAIRPKYENAKYNIARQSYREFVIYLLNNSPDEITLRFTWDDKSGCSKDNTITMQF